ncbi:MAG TPA: inorganic phosphate transporter [Thermotoga sp.]|nr:inorganic phosphate transporter [Thermotoga sp.]
MIFIFPAIFLGWALGANDAANVFGPSVASGLVPYRKAIIVSAIFVVIGAIVGGAEGLKTIGSLSTGGAAEGALSILSAAISVTIMTYLGLPVSTSQAVVGGIVGIGLILGGINWKILLKVVIAWLATPFGAMLLGYILYKIATPIFRRIKSVQIQDLSLKIVAWIVGAYGSFSLGANNVANVTGALVGSYLSIPMAALIGGLSIAFGILTYSKKVMMTVGKKIVELDHFSSLISIFAESLTVWVYALIGVPVSTSQAIVGGVLGAGYAKGTSLGSKKILLRIIFGWVGTPTVAGIISMSVYWLYTKL